MEGPRGIVTLYALVHWGVMIKYVIFRYFWILHQTYYQLAIKSNLNRFRGSENV